MTGSSQSAIVFGLAQTLTEAGLTQAGLAEMNFDPGALAAYLRKVNPGVDRDFSVAEQATYRQAVQFIESGNGSGGSPF